MSGDRPTAEGGQRAVVWVTMAVVAVVAMLSLAACDQVEAALDRVTGEGAPEIPTSVDLLVLDFMDEHGFPGATLAITKGGRLVWSKGYGYANSTEQTQMEPRHRTWVGSVAKLITTVVVMQLVEEGVIDLDDHIYATSATPLWGSESGTTPGLISSGEGLLDDAHGYLASIIEGVEHLNQWFPPAQHIDDTSSPEWSLMVAAHEDQISQKLSWATEIRLRHLLSHTSGLRGGGDGELTAEEFDKPQTEITYPEVHHTKLRGRDGEVFLGSAPGAVRSYSNHGFGLTGLIVHEQTGNPYIAETEARVLHPLGLHDVVPVRTNVSHLDAHRHNPNVDPPAPWNHDEEVPKYNGPVPSVSVATGGWAATAQDLVRIACALDAASNNLRLLSHASVDEMATVQFPQASGKGAKNQPLGWDAVANSVLSKGGATGRGGRAMVRKYLPGAFEGTDEEINIAIALNMHRKDVVPRALLNQIAAIVASTAIDEDFDLFDPSYRCYVPPAQRIQPPPTRDQPIPNRSVPRAEGTPEPTPEPASTPTRAPRRTAASPTPTPEPTTPTPTPTREPTDPSIRGVRLDPDEIWEATDRMSCGPTESTVSAHVEGPSAIASVELRWSINETTGSTPMQHAGGSTWTGALGPFPSGTLASGDRSDEIAITVVATGPDGRTATHRSAMILHACPPIPQ